MTSTPYSGLADDASAWGSPTTGAPAPASLPAPPPAGPNAYSSLADAAASWGNPTPGASAPAAPTQTTDPGFWGWMEHAVQGEGVPILASAALGSAGIPFAGLRIAKKFTGLGNSPTANTLAAFKAAKQYAPLQAQAATAQGLQGPVEPTFDVGAAPVPLSSFGVAPAPTKDPSLLKYTKTQVLDPTLTAADLGDFNANTASRVQQALPSLADRAARNAAVSQGYAQPGEGSLFLPSDLADQVVQAKAQHQAALEALNSLPPSEPVVSPLAAEAQRAKDAYTASVVSPWKGTELPKASYWSELGDPGVAAGKAQGALESLYPNPAMRTAVKMATKLPTSVMPVIGGALTGLTAGQAVNDFQSGNYGRGAANALAALGDVLMIPDNPVLPVAGAAMQIPALAYGAYDAVRPYAHKLWDEYVSPPKSKKAP